jgi:hypothetical protein
MVAYSFVCVCLLLGTGIVALQYISIYGQHFDLGGKLLDDQKYFLSDTVTALPRSSSERFSSELLMIEKQPNSSELLMTPKDEEKQPKFVLSILDQQGYWIGNTWVPSKGWKLYSPEEM